MVSKKSDILSAGSMAMFLETRFKGPKHHRCSASFQFENVGSCSVSYPFGKITRHKANKMEVIVTVLLLLYPSKRCQTIEVIWCNLTLFWTRIFLFYLSDSSWGLLRKSSIRSGAKMSSTYPRSADQAACQDVLGRCEQQASTCDYQQPIKK